MLLEGYTYDQIKVKLKVGLNTISQIERWLHEGFGGYKNAFANFRKKYPEKNYFEEGNVPLSKEWTRKKYPLHYLLVNLLRKNKYYHTLEYDS